MLNKFFKSIYTPFKLVPNLKGTLLFYLLSGLKSSKSLIFTILFKDF
ncbi:hypothetical protein HMPREF9401_0551 [Aliarcobacter butzleri JV22]|nr:hypothetical protein HMPREF9401_0551 [Aliarcobacter butzleri JV22]KLE04415.1 hypothetical protein AF78_08625 [Aliarcobacter butzleri L353]